MKTVMVKLRRNRVIKTDDAPDLARFVTDWALNKTSLTNVLNFVRASTLDNEHLASAVLQYGKLIHNRHDNGLDAFECKDGLAAARMFSALLENRWTRSGAVDCFWGERPKSEPLWVLNLMKGLSEEANLQLLVEKHSPSPSASPETETRLLIASAVPDAQKPRILMLAKKRRKLPALYEATLWEECRYLASEAHCTQILESDIGL